MDGTKDSAGLVRDYFPSARGLKTHQYTLAIYITRDYKRRQILLFDDKADPYQTHNLADSPEARPVLKHLVKRMERMLADIDDPWAHLGIAKRILR